MKIEGEKIERCSIFDEILFLDIWFLLVTSTATQMVKAKNNNPQKEMDKKRSIDLWMESVLCVRFMDNMYKWEAQQQKQNQTD